MTSEMRSFKTQDGRRRQFGYRKTLAISNYLVDFELIDNVRNA